ncbi:MAG: hypothetical protein ABIG63_06860 [Chloroflexota bacterium]
MDIANFILQPSPRVTISDAPTAELPLYSFHLIVLVEPDPETWMHQPGSEEIWGEIVQRQNDAIEDELRSDSPGLSDIPSQVDYFCTTFALIHYEDAYNFYDQLLEMGFIHTIFHLIDYNHLDNFGYYVKGIAHENPTWRVAVIGAMLKEDVIRIANLVSETGLSTTVLSRYCLTRESFINIDAHDDYKSWLLSPGMEDEESS